jgi:predicted AAA+ superfamily ATPase
LALDKRFSRKMSSSKADQDKYLEKLKKWVKQENICSADTGLALVGNYYPNLTSTRSAADAFKESKELIKMAAWEKIMKTWEGWMETVNHADYDKIEHRKVRVPVVPTM